MVRTSLMLLTEGSWPETLVPSKKVKSNSTQMSGGSCSDAAAFIGDRARYSRYCLLDGTGGLTIGSDCSISAGSQIASQNTVKWARSELEACVAPGPGPKSMFLEALDILKTKESFTFWEIQQPHRAGA